MSLRTILPCLAIVAVSFSCKTPERNNSEPQSIAALPITIAIAESIIGELTQIAIELQWKKVESRYLANGGHIGDISEREAAATASLLSAQADQAYLDDLRSKLNSLQDTLTRDYVAGSPDASQLLALMADKANDIRNLIETQAEATNDTKITNALGSYQSYLLVSSLSLAIMGERMRVASVTPGVAPEVIAKMRAHMSSLARECERHVARINGQLFEAYANKNLIKREFISEAGSVDFGFESKVSYRYCITGRSGTRNCGAPSKTTCITEMNATCVKQAQAEAQANLAASGKEQEVLAAARREFFAVDLGKFADRMMAQAGASR